jgi:carbamoyltransferase
MVSRRFAERFGPARAPEGPLTQRDADLARSAQEVIELLVLGMARHAADLTGQRRAVLAGGVALNCVANARLQREGPFDELWIQPAAGDAGSALGAALYGYHQLLDQPRHCDGTNDLMRGSFLGPSFGDDEVATWLQAEGHPHRTLAPEERNNEIARRLADGRIVAVVQGRMEFGPRALGHRSILADPRSASVQSTLNLRTKQRESFRPFAPAVLEEHASEWFELEGASPYMLLTAPVARTHDVEQRDAPTEIMDRIHEVRSSIPAVTHVDGSARVQTVGPADRHLRPILEAFDRLTGCPVLVNTSFNIRGEPIVCTPEDAYRCFVGTEIDDLVIGSHLLQREDQDLTTAASRRRDLD